MVNKFKEMDVIRKLNIAFICVFVLAMLLPYVFAERSAEQRASYKENRALAAYPKMFIDGQFNEKYFDDFESWLQDNMKGRSTIVKANATLQYKLFGKIAKTDVLKGKSGWMFSNTDDCIAYNTDTNSIGLSEAEDYIDQLEKLNSYVRSRGCDFYFYVPVAKETVYPEEYANGVRLSAVHDFDVVFSMLAARNSEVKAIYGKENMLSHRDEYIYYKYSDVIHWNSNGAFYGYQELMNRIKEDYPDIYVLADEDVTRETNVVPADIYGYTYPLEDEFTEYYVANPKAVDISEKEIHNYPMVLAPDCFAMYSNSSVENNHRLLIMGDSFVRMFIKDRIAEGFSETLHLDEDNMIYLGQFMDAFDPDIVVYEIVDIDIVNSLSRLKEIEY